MSQTKYKRINIGTVSHATMRLEDLIPAFLYELLAQTPCKREHRKRACEIQRSIKENYFRSEDAAFDLEWLFDALNEYAPAYFYFGAHPGDGSDYGFWLSEGFEYDFEGLKVSDLAEVPRGFTGEVLLVNDHGNPSLYNCTRGRLREVWSIV